MSELGVETVRELLRYEPESGKLYWRERRSAWFPSDHRCKIWNTRYAGREAFTSVNRGYRVGSVFKRFYPAHRVVWVICTGSWPVEQIDHINGIRSDNRLSNLREASCAENGRNQQLRASNTSGVNGVRDRNGRWVAEIMIDGARVHLGRFGSREAAAAARAAADVQYGFSERHGTSGPRQSEERL